MVNNCAYHTQDAVPIEIAVLLCCGRAELDDLHRERLNSLLAGPIDWDRMLNLAQQHKMIPLLNRHLSTLGAVELPPLARERLARQSGANSRQALVLTQELIRLIDILQRGGVNTLALKGPALAFSLYGSLALRQFGDIDIWVDKADIPRACDLLTAHGCSLNNPLERPAPGRAEAAFLRYGSEHNYSFFLPDLGLTLEMHWLPAPRHFGVPLTFAQAWERRTVCRLGGVSVPVLGTADQLVFLAAHGAKHQWMALEWLADAAEQAARLDLQEWEQAWATARKSRFTRALHLALILAERWLEMPIPAMEQRKDLEIERLVSQLEARLIAEKTGPMSPWNMALFCLRVREHWQDRLVCFTYLVFGPNSQDLDALPPGHRSFLPTLFGRPGRLLRKYRAHKL